MARQCVFLSTRKANGSYAGVLGGVPVVEPPEPRRKRFRWDHVISIDCSYVPNAGISGVLSLFLEFDNEPDSEEYLVNQMTGMIIQRAALQMMSRLFQMDFEPLPPSSEPFGPTDRFVGVISTTARLPKRISQGKQLFGTLRQSLPPIEAISNLVASDDSEVIDQYVSLLVRETPIHRRSSVRAVLGGWRHTPRQEIPYKEHGVLLLSQLQCYDGWLETWLTPKGNVRIERVTV